VTTLLRDRHRVRCSIIQASEPIVEQRARFDLPAPRICRPVASVFFTLGDAQASRRVIDVTLLNHTLAIPAAAPSTVGIPYNFGAKTSFFPVINLNL